MVTKCYKVYDMIRPKPPDPGGGSAPGPDVGGNLTTCTPFQNAHGVVTQGAELRACRGKIHVKGVVFEIRGTMTELA